MRGFLRPLDVALAAGPAIACVAAALLGASLAAPLVAPLAPPLAAQALQSASSPAGANASTAAVAPTTPLEKETAMLRWGTTVVWFRATDADSVLVFASTGFRNPFVHAVAMSSDDADRWAAFDERLMATVASGSSGGDPQSAAGPQSDTAHMILGVGDVILEPTLDRDGVALRTNIGANRQDGLLVTLYPDAAPSAAEALHDAARTARALHMTAVGEAAAAAMPAPASPTSVAVSSGSTQLAATAPSPSPPPPRAPTTPTTTVPHHRASARPAGAAPYVPSQTIAAVSVRTATQPLGAPPSSPSSPAAAPTSGQVSAVSLVAPIAGLTPVVISATNVPATTTSGDRALTGVDDVTVRNLVHQWQPELEYCYTEYGLRSHPELVGAVVVRVTLIPDGSVSHAAVARHSWSGGGATDVENCIRARVSAWHFPPASTSSVHEIPLNFGR